MKRGVVVEIVNWKELLYPYEQAMDELLLKFRYLDKECRHLGIYSPIDSVTGRLKKPASILEKAGKKQIPPEEIEEKIEDITGIRILCQFVEDIEKVVGMVRGRKDMTVVEERDYITKTKASGYRSYHMIIRYPLSTALGPKEVLAEIQIRTNAMNFWATAEHSLRYKYSGNIPESLQQRLINCAEAAFHLDQEMSTIRGEITNAQRLNEIKGNLVTNILDNIQNLYFETKLEQMDEINKEFVEIWNKEDIDELKAFNEKLNVLAEVYRV
ncbi:GTP pyrophosphokinase YjbM [Anaerotignum neopropionicum]|uniref:GTP pyrophosphokinase YjbM n=1 Tax=Anaerotignum neopropionicum TaxID=36847 RepID=A0A136WCS4_9FIRM|nr:GTP pyrophosphokinase family protein [Anaerotignum neopropionicum]KXL52290.1 GTP pyrophosphokinase YjbM [Anaerotignum neopropionicum]